MGQGNHAFSHSPYELILGSIFLHSGGGGGGPRNNLAPMEN